LFPLCNFLPFCFCPCGLKTSNVLRFFSPTCRRRRNFHHPGGNHHPHSRTHNIHGTSHCSMPFRIKMPAAFSHHSKLLGSSVDLARIVRSTFPSICIFVGASVSISIPIAIVAVIFAIPLCCSLYPSSLRCLSSVRTLVLKYYGCESTYIVAPRVGNPSCGPVIHTFIVSRHIGEC